MLRVILVFAWIFTKWLDICRHGFAFLVTESVNCSCKCMHGFVFLVSPFELSLRDIKSIQASMTTGNRAFALLVWRYLVTVCVVQCIGTVCVLLCSGVRPLLWSVRESFLMMIMSDSMCHAVYWCQTSPLVSEGVLFLSDAVWQHILCNMFALSRCVQCLSRTINEGEPFFCCHSVMMRDSVCHAACLHCIIMRTVCAELSVREPSSHLMRRRIMSDSVCHVACLHCIIVRISMQNCQWGSPLLGDGEGQCVLYSIFTLHHCVSVHAGLSNRASGQWRELCWRGCMKPVRARGGKTSTSFSCFSLTS